MLGESITNLPPTNRELAVAAVGAESERLSTLLRNDPATRSRIVKSFAAGKPEAAERLIPSPGPSEELVLAAFDCLTLRQQRLLLLHKEGRTYKQIAKHIGGTETTTSVLRVLIAAISEMNDRLNGITPLDVPVPIDREERDLREIRERSLQGAAV